jgi:hypothetical protein
MPHKRTENAMSEWTEDQHKFARGVRATHGILMLARESPTLFPACPAFTSGQEAETAAWARIKAGKPCVRCAKPSTYAHIALTKDGRRWMDLCMECGFYMSVALDLVRRNRDK